MSATDKLLAAAKDTRTCLNQCLGIIVEFGDLNGFRNLSAEELGKAVMQMAIHGAGKINAIDRAIAAYEQEKKNG